MTSGDYAGQQQFNYEVISLANTEPEIGAPAPPVRLSDSGRLVSVVLLIPL